MSRKIKFRCFWKGVNQMRYFSPGCFEHIKNVGYAMTFTLSNENPEKSIYMGKAEVMQFTGLHDKTGKEIYEGDVVEFIYNNETVRCNVVWNKENAAFALEWRNGYINNWFLNPNRYEVIGNVYQPQLTPKK